VFSTQDSLVGAPFTYSLVAGSGSADNSAFNITGTQLRINASPDFETKSSYNVRVRVADSGGLSNERAFVIQVTKANPVVQSIVRANSAPANMSSSSATFAVTFSEPVTGVDAADFQVVTTGNTTATSTVVVSPVSTSVYNVTVNGISGAGTVGVNLIDNTTIRDAMNQGLVSSSISYQSQQVFSTSTSPYIVATADVNGDGKLDAIVPNYGSNTVGTLSGNGDGTFQAQQTFPVSGNPVFVAAADLNGDGMQDLIVCNYSANTVGVLRGNGDGTFQAQVTYASGLGPYSVAIGDMNADGKPDIVVANYNNATIGIFPGNGNGTFQSMVSYTTGTGPISVAVADFNGDGNLDVVNTNYIGNSFSILKGNGNGTLQSAVTLATGSNPAFQAVADFNRDGYVDVAVANLGASTVGVFKGNGDGTFQSQSTFGVPLNPQSVAIADANGDGILDLLTSNVDSSSVSILQGVGNGTFLTQQAFGVGNGPTGASFGDLNNDGKPDVIAANTSAASISSLLNNSGSFRTGQTYTVLGQVVSTSFTASGTLTAGVTSMTVTFNGPLTGIGTPSYYQLQQAGSDGLLLNADSIITPNSVTVSGNTATLNFATPLAEDVYRLTVKDLITDAAGNRLDGDGDGLETGNWRRDFVAGALSTTLTSPNGFVLDPEFGGFGAGQLTQGTGNAFDGLGRLEVGGVPMTSVSSTIPALSVTKSVTTATSVLLSNSFATVPGLATYTAATTGTYHVGGHVYVAGTIVGSGAYVQLGLYANGVLQQVRTYNLIAGGQFYSLEVDDTLTLTAGSVVDLRTFTNSSALSYFNSSGTGSGTLRVEKVNDIPSIGPALSVIKSVTTTTSVLPNILATVPGLATYTAAATGTYHVYGHVYVAGTIGGSGGYVQLGLYAPVLQQIRTYNLVAGGQFYSMEVDDTLTLTAGSVVHLRTFTNSSALSFFNSGGTGSGTLRVEKVNDIPSSGPALSVTKSVTTTTSVLSNVLATVPGLATYTAAATGTYHVGGHVYVGGTIVGSGAYVQLGLYANGVLQQVRTYNLIAGGQFYSLEVDDSLTLSAGSVVDLRTLTNSTALSFFNSSGTGSGTLRVEKVNNIPQPVVDDSNQTVVVPSGVLANLIVSREITVNSTGGQDFARTTDVFSNPTGGAITVPVPVKILGNVGSDAATSVFATSDGDFIVEPTDLWFGTDDASVTGGTPAIVHLLHGPFGLQPASVNVSEDNVQWTYNLTFAAGETKRLASFTVLGTTRQQAIDAANALVTSSGFGGQAAAFLTPSELSSLANFVFTTTDVGIAGGNLVITDSASGTTNDTLKITQNGLYVRISDPNNFLGAGENAIQINANTIDVLQSDITGSIQVNTLGGDDSLTIDFSSGNFGKAIAFDGGTQTTGDSLTLIGGATFANVSHTFTNASTGTVDVIGNSQISYTGLEPVFDNLSATDRVFTFNGGAETISVTDGIATDGKTNIDSTLSESVYFTNPTGSLTINAGSGNDVVTVTSVDAGYNASLTISGDAGNDTVNLNGDITFASNKSLDVDITDDAIIGDVDSIQFGTNANLILLGSGAASLKASKSIAMASGSSVVTVNGSIILGANNAGTTTGDFDAIDVNGATIQSTGSGNVTLIGNGGQGGIDPVGVLLRSGSIVSGGTSGTVSVTGIGGTGSGPSNIGIHVNTSSWITSSGANVLANGTGGGAGASAQNYGVFVSTNSEITAGSAGTVSVTGQGGNFTSGTGSNNFGVYVGSTNSHIRSSGGNVSVVGIGGGSIGTIGNDGIYMDNTGEISAGGTGNVTISGTGAGGNSGPGNFNHGVLLDGAGVRITSSGGNISVTGTGGFGSVSNGIDFEAGARVSAIIGTPTVTLVADSMRLNSTTSIDAAANSVVLRPKTNGTLISLGGGDIIPGTLGLTDAELDTVIAGKIRIGDANSGNLTVTTGISPAGTNTISLSSGGAITETSGSLIVSNLAVQGASVNLASTTNEVSNLAGLTTSGASAFVYRDATGISITTVDGVSGISTINSNVSISTGAGDVSLDVAGFINAGTGDVSLTTGSSNAISTADNIGTDVTADDVILNAGSNGIGTPTNFLRLAATTIAATTSGNGSINLVETDNITIAAAGLNAGTGLITLSGGTYTLGGSDRINDTADVNVSGGATLAMGTNLETIDQLILTDGSVTGNGTGKLTGTSTFDVRKGSISLILAGPVGLLKTTVDTVALTGTNEYTGSTTINAGELSIGASIGPATTNVAAGGLLTGIGRVGVVTLGGGSINPGAVGSGGTFNVSGVSASTNSTLQVDLGVVSDQLVVDTAPNLANMTLSANVVNNYVPVPGDSFVIVRNDSTGAVVGTFNGLSEGSSLVVNGVNCRITYVGGNGNDVVVFLPPLYAISGTVWNDANANAVREPSELGMSGVTVYVDLNNNGTRDPNETSYVSEIDNPNTPIDERGAYSLGVNAGSYVIRREQPTTIAATFPDGPAVNVGGLPSLLDSYQSVSITNQSIENINFGNTSRQVRFAIETQSVTENSGTLAVEIELDSPFPYEISLPITVQGIQATQGTDFTVSSTTVTFAPNTTTSNLLVTIVDDNRNEANESFLLTLGGSYGVGATTPISTTITISNDDLLPSIQFDKINDIVSETNTTINVLAKLDRLSDLPVTIPITHGGSATPGVGADYLLAGGLSYTIPAGIQSIVIPVQIYDDAVVELGESIIITMGTPTNAVKSLTGASTRTIVIQDNDAPSITLTKVAQTTAENASPFSVVSIVATLSSPAVSAIDIPFTFVASDLALASLTSDYTTSSSVFHFDGLSGSLASRTTSTITMTIVNDNVVEPTEQVNLKLNLAGQSVVLPGNTLSQVVTINDDDKNYISFTTDNGTPVWEDQGIVSIVVNMSKASTQEVRVPVVVGNVANGAIRNT
ncbi:MAG: FG-GAP-like repeat-containing protein, partial [Pirellula sp.]